MSDKVLREYTTDMELVKMIREDSKNGRITIVGEDHELVKEYNTLCHAYADGLVILMPAEIPKSRRNDCRKALAKLLEEYEAGNLYTLGTWKWWAWTVAVFLMAVIMMDGIFAWRLAQ